MACVKMHNGSPTIFIDDKPVFGAMVMTDKLLTGWKGVPDPYFVAMYEAGFRQFQVCPTGTSGDFDNAYNPETDDFSREALASTYQELKEYADRYPDVLFMLRIFTQSRNVKGAWYQKYPDQYEQVEEGKIDKTPSASYASKIARKHSNLYLKATIETVQSLGLDDNILGILVCDGYTYEWCKYACQDDIATDYSKPMEEYFREWLAGEYKTDAALQTAWGNPNVTLATAVVPSPDAQRAVSKGMFRDPVKECNAIDYFRALAHLVAELISEQCGAVKEYSGGKYLAGVFYGYLMDNINNCGYYIPGWEADHTWGARSGHAGLVEVLKCGHVDFMSSPYRYDRRGMGGEGGFRSPYESVRQAGILWLSEEDIRTHLYRPDAGYGMAKNPWETVQLIRRQCANVLAHSAAAWFCDWWVGDAGAFDHPAVMAELRRFVQLGTEALQDPDRGSNAEIALVVDPKSPLIRTLKNDLDMANYFSMAWEFPHIGAPVDYVMLTDLVEGNARQYKVYYMLDAYSLEPQERAKLKAFMERDNAVVIWTYAAGISDGQTVDIEHMAETTGFRFKARKDRWALRSAITNFRHPITADLPQTMHWGSDRFVEPLVVGDDPEALVLGNVVINEGRHEDGFLLKQFKNHTAIWCAAQGLPAQLLRNIAKYAGVHIYNEEGDVLYASREFIMLHSLKGGSRTVKLPCHADVYDTVRNIKVASDTLEFIAEFGNEATVLYRLIPTE